MNANQNETQDKTIGNAEKTIVTIKHEASKGKGSKAAKTGKDAAAAPETTPILGLLPSMTENVIEARLKGYVQGVEAVRDDGIEKLQKAAAGEVGKAHVERQKRVVASNNLKQRQISDEESRYYKALYKLKGEHHSALAKIQTDHDVERDGAEANFRAVVRPIETKLTAAVQAVKGEAAGKLRAASDEYTPVFAAARAKRLEAEAKAKVIAEAAAKEVEAAKATEASTTFEAIETAEAAKAAGSRTGHFSASDPNMSNAPKAASATA